MLSSGRTRPGASGVHAPACLLSRACWTRPPFSFQDACACAWVFRLLLSFWFSFALFSRRCTRKMEPIHPCPTPSSPSPRQTPALSGSRVFVSVCYTRAPPLGEGRRAEGASRAVAHFSAGHQQHTVITPHNPHCLLHNMEERRTAMCEIFFHRLSHNVASLHGKVPAVRTHHRPTLRPPCSNP